MIAYASRTGTRTNLEALRAAGWRLMVSARGVLRTEGMPYALDNGAWTAYRRGERFDEPAFLRALMLLGPNADFVVVPDIVCQGALSLRFSEAWLPRLQPLGHPLLLAVQNGIVPRDVEGLVGPRLGLFVGGDSPWKERTLPFWGDLALSSNCHFHVGRVNTVRRIRLCVQAQADSFDGSSASRYCKTLEPLDRARKETALIAR
jgi:hypothetical protein